MSAIHPHRPAIMTPMDYVPVGDGTFRAVPRKPIEVASVTAASKMTGVKRDVIYKLYHAGFIRATQASPRKLLIYMDSLNKHIEEASDPEFWTPDRKSRFFSGCPG